MSAKRILGLALLLAATTAQVTPEAWAQTDPFARNFDAVPNKATPAQNSGIALEGTQPNARGSFRAALLADVNFNILSLKLGDDKLANLLPFRADGHLLFAYQILRRFELGVDLPVTLYQSNNFSQLRDRGFTGEGNPGKFGLGDLRLIPRIFLLTEEDFWLGVALALEVRLPTGDGQSFIGDPGALFAPRVLLSHAFGKLRVLANAGLRLRRPGQYLNLLVDDQIALGAGVIYALGDLGKLRRTELMAETHLATPWANPFTFNNADSLKSPWEVLVGMRGRFGNHWGAELDLGRGVTAKSGYGREDFRILASVSYVFEAADRDQDGIPDDRDGCPDVKEDLDGFEDSDGCPESDNDKDNIPDKDDLCPNQPGIKELDGCPDTDGDEVPDPVDKCPEVAGPPENDGCPMEGPAVVLESDRIRVRGNIQFDFNSAVIKKQSNPLLDETYEVLKKHPELGLVSIEGHTDSIGSASYNLDLSKRRAKSVVEYLVAKGIPQERLISDGFGFERPIATNKTALGRAKNRRVEFKLVRDQLKKKSQQPAPAEVPSSPAPSETIQSEPEKLKEKR